MASKKNSVWTRQNMRTLTDRMSGASRQGSINKITPGKQTGEAFQQQGKGYVDAYNLREGISKSEVRTLAETALGRDLTKSEYRKLRWRELKSGSGTETSRPVDPRTGYRLNLNRTMTAFRITFS